MRRCSKVLVGVGLITLGASAGCASNGMWLYPNRNQETLTMSPEEHHHQIETILRADRRSLADDLDLLFMTDRPSRLSRWHSH